MPSRRCARRPPFRLKKSRRAALSRSSLPSLCRCTPGRARSLPTGRRAGRLGSSPRSVARTRRRRTRPAPGRVPRWRPDPEWCNSPRQATRAQSWATSGSRSAAVPGNRNADDLGRMPDRGQAGNDTGMRASTARGDDDRARFDAGSPRLREQLVGGHDITERTQRRRTANRNEIRFSPRRAGR